MDDLIAALVSYGPLGVIAGLFIFMLRKQILMAVLGSDTEKMAEVLLGSMAKSFEENLVCFKKTLSIQEAILNQLKANGKTQDDMADGLRQLAIEVARNSGK